MSEGEFDVRLGLTAAGHTLASATAAAFADVRIPAPAEESPFLFEGTLAEYRERAEDDKMTRQLQNDVRKCSACGKSCGYTTTECNACGAALPEEVVHTDNVFMGFIYGVRRCSFPLSISIRHQTPEILVFDDPLALAACHFCAIPTNLYCPDWRMLLRAPAAGLRLIEQLEDAAWQCVEAQFLSSERWREKHVRTPDMPPAELRKHVVAGCNFPPSQFQLHIQYFLMPWLPSHYGFFIDGAALVRKRWFPLAYIKEVLALKQPMEVTMETTLDEIFAVFDDKVSYNDAFDRELERVATAHAAMANWQPSDFAVAVVGDTVVEGTPPEGATPKQLIEADKKLLQSHGPVKTYYQFARAGGQPVPEFGRPQPAKL